MRTTVIAHVGLGRLTSPRNCCTCASSIGGASGSSDCDNIRDMRCIIAAAASSK